jgi:hypothetical protein
MSDRPSDDRDRLDLAELVSRIERRQEESRAIASEQNKLMVERARLEAEQARLDAERPRPRRGRLLAPRLAIIGLVGALITIASAIARFLQ